MLFMVSVLCHFTASAQIKYQSNILTVGNTDQFLYYYGNDCRKWGLF